MYGVQKSRRQGLCSSASALAIALRDGDGDGCLCCGTEFTCTMDLSTMRDRSLMSSSITVGPPAL